ncbi:MAG: restriction endonuclease [Thiomargarita sp.]|nr:restriction endonuclease [Thiomargarita sp.]
MITNTDAIFQAKLLLKLARKNGNKRIYHILNNLSGSSTYKGDVFEYFLAGLYNGIGWKAIVAGGKDDKGVDIILYHPNDLTKVHVIIQAKNTKTRLSKKDLRNEYANFFGDDFLVAQSTAEKYNCQIFIIIALNGYTQNADKFTCPNPDKYKISHHSWINVKNLIYKYARNHYYRPILPKKKSPPFSKKDKITLLIIFSIMACISNLAHYSTLNLFKLQEIFNIQPSISIEKPIVPQKKIIDKNTLTNAMIKRLHKVKLTSFRKKDCKRFNYPIAKCPQLLVNRYKNYYGNGDLKTGLVIYICGEGYFKRGRCKAFEKKASYLLTGKK